MLRVVGTPAKSLRSHHATAPRSLQTKPQINQFQIASRSILSTSRLLPTSMNSKALFSPAPVTVSLSHNLPSFCNAPLRDAPPLSRIFTRRHSSSTNRAQKTAEAAESLLKTTLAKNELVVSETKNPFIASYQANSVAANSPIEDTMAQYVDENIAIFGVYDGHSGIGASHWLKDAFIVKYLLPELNRLETRTVDSVKGALTEAFMSADKTFLLGCLDRHLYEMGRSGACTLVAVVIPIDKEPHLFVANAGDCRAVLVTEQQDGQFLGTALSRDQTGEDPIEVERIRREHPNESDAISRGRVKGYLQPTRGIGDGLYKMAEYNSILKKKKGIWNPPYTTAEPEIQHQKLGTRDRFLVLATDGLWDFTENQQMASIVGVVSRETPDTNVATLAIRSILKRASTEFGSNEEALLAQKGNLRRYYYDDTTLTVVKFKTQV